MKRPRPLLLLGLGAAVAVLAVDRARPAPGQYPSGRAGVERMFGKFSWQDLPGGAVQPERAWELGNIVPVRLHTGKIVRMHQFVARDFARTFERACKASGWTPRSVQTYVPRHVDHDPKKPLSLHSWGIAVDFDPGDNPRTRKREGTVTMHPAFVREFDRAGWTWGGRWKGNSYDPMHFQAASVI